MGIKTADRTLDLIELFARVQAPLTLSSVAEKLSIPASSAHGLIKTLQARGYLYELSSRQGYYLTKRFSHMADAISIGMPLVMSITPHMQRLCDDLSESVVLAKRQGDAVTYLEVIECRQSIRFSPVVGEVKSLHCSATGKAILGSMQNSEFEKVLTRLKLDARTEKTITQARTLEAEIKAQRRRGWYQVIGENIPDLMSIAVPFLAGGEIYVVGVGGPINRFKPLMAKHASKLRQACSEMQELLN